MTTSGATGSWPGQTSMRWWGRTSGMQERAGLTTEANEHDTVSVLAAVEVVLY
jgi:hypothetical protein